ncbi:serine threonine [Cordyceps militaris]|uniref:Serine threonine n=1 Tax=Cordyceps militaris TaxID=73501 RepID=A0A2H4SHU1_CORMI|nr:serine threonine [Cordyceps militaris]
MYDKGDTYSSLAAVASKRHTRHPHDLSTCSSGFGRMATWPEAADPTVKIASIRFNTCFKTIHVDDKWLNITLDNSGHFDEPRANVSKNKYGVRGRTMKLEA